MKRILVVFLSLLLIGLLPTTADALSVSSKGAVLMNGTTGEIIWEKDAHERLSMASTTKIMTALLLCENADLNETIITTDEMVRVEGSSMGLLAGDTVSYHDLLYGMMLASGNDAANTVAISLAGNATDFAKMMNDKAKEIGMVNSNFVTPSGLDDENHYSTAYDMALLARYALNNENFAAAAGSVSKKLCYGNPPYNRTLTNHNKLLKTYDGLIGVKTGFTKKSGRCLVTAAKRGNEYLIAVTLGCPDDWRSHEALLDFGFTQLEDCLLQTEEYEVTVVGSEKNKVTAFCEDITLSLTEKERQGIHKKVYLPRFVYSGVKKGDTVGRVDYILGEKIIASRDIFAAESANRIQKKENKFLKCFIMLFKAMV